MIKTRYKTMTGLLLLLLSLFSFKSFAEKSYDLNELVELLKERNLLLKIADLDRDIVKQEYREARALPNPEIEIVKGEGEFLENPEKNDVWGVGLNLSIPNPLYRFFFLKSLRKTIDKAEIEVEIRKKSVIRELKTHYFRLQFSRKIAALLQEKIKRLTEVNRITKAKASIGEAKEIDALRTSVEIRKNKSLAFRFEKITANEKTKINEFLDFSLQKDISLVEDFGFVPLTGIESRIDNLVKKSPLIVLKLKELDRKKIQVKAEKYSLIESITVFGERGKEVEARLWKFGIGFSIPLFNTKSAVVKKAKYEREKAQKEFEHAKKHLFADVNRVISGIRILEQEIETLTDAVLKEGRKNIELSEILYKEGEIPLIVFIDSQNSFFEIEERYYEAITEWKILKATLEELSGEEL